MKQHPYLLSAASGVCAGFINGFFGAGGGMVLVPLLVRLCRIEDKKAFSTTVCIILPICIVSLLVYASQGMLPLGESVPYLLGGAAGGVLAGLLFQKISADALHLILGILIVFGGVRLIVC